VPPGEGTGVVTATGGTRPGNTWTRGWRSPAHVLQAVFNVRPDEGRTVALLVALTLCVQAGTGVGSSSLQALFFARLGVQLLPAMALHDHLASQPQLSASLSQALAA
jgi:hypothetical protein